MWPPVVGLMSKVVPAGGAMILGKFVPGGTGIGYSAWALHRKKETFGSDAEILRPERWLSGSGVVEMNKTVDLVFGYGKNACLGKPIAQMEMRKTVAELMRRFDISIVRPEAQALSYGQPTKRPTLTKSTLAVEAIRRRRSTPLQS